MWNIAVLNTMYRDKLLLYICGGYVHTSYDLLEWCEMIFVVIAQLSNRQNRGNWSCIDNKTVYSTNRQMPKYQVALILVFDN